MRDCGKVSAVLAEDVTWPREVTDGDGDEEEEEWVDWEEEMAELLNAEGDARSPGRSRSPSPLPPRHPSDSSAKRRRSGGDCGGEAGGNKAPKIRRNDSLADWINASPPPGWRSSLDGATSARSPSVEFRPPLTNAREASPVLHPNLASTGSATTTAEVARGEGGEEKAEPRKSELEGLPYEVLRRVMCCLSAEGLATLGQTSRQLRTFSNDNSLWRRLYLGRWNMPDAHQLKMHRQRGALSWMGYYKDRDIEESHKTLERLPEEMREAVVAMNKARRKTTISLTSGTGQSGDLAFADASEADKVVEWRRQAGKPDRVPFHTCLTTHAAGPPCQYVRVGDAMICQRSGWAHVCEDTCPERIPSPSGMMVCPISGRCFEMLVEEEEDAGRGGCGGEVHDDDFHFGERGALGRSFEAGYSCSNEQDLQWFCGASLC